MKFIRIREHVPAPGQEYAIGSYPGDGLYLDAQNNALYLVNNGMISSFTADQFNIEDRDIEGGGVSEALFLHALKIVADGGRG